MNSSSYDLAAFTKFKRKLRQAKIAAEIMTCIFIILGAVVGLGAAVIKLLEWNGPIGLLLSALLIIGAAALAAFVSTN